MLIKPIIWYSLMIFLLVWTAYGSHTRHEIPTRASSFLQSAENQNETDILQQDQVTEGTTTYRGFLIDHVLHSETNGDIHFHLFIPESYDGSSPYALFLTLPGYEGLLFQGVGANLYTEAYAFEAQRYHPEMIIAAPQLNDWGETSANQTIALTEYLLSHYAIDPNNVYLQGYSGGGETGSIVMGKRPELYTAYLAVSTQWEGDLQALVQAQTPVYLVTGEADHYYGASQLRETYAHLSALYEAKGLTKAEIDDLVVLDIKPSDYFTVRGYTDQHAGGVSFAFDQTIMSWLFSR